MRSIVLLVALVICTLLASALLAWPLHLLLQSFTDIPYHKIVSRLTSLLALVFIFVYLYLQGSLNRDTAGFAGNRRQNLRALLTGIAAGLMIMLVLATALLSLNIHQWEPEFIYTPGNLSIILIKAILAGLLVGLVEETVYRGALLGGLMKNVRTYTAIFISSLLYAAVHFVKFRALPEDTHITLFTGVGMLPDAFFRFADPAIIDSFISLFIFGVLLALIRVREGNIYICMGLHAGVVMAIKIINEVTDFVPHNSLAWLVSKYDHLLGHLTTSWLIILTFTYIFYTRLLSAKR